MGFGSLGIWEMAVIAVIILVFFGPARLPEIARSTGKALREFRRGMNEVRRELELAERDEARARPSPTHPAPTGARREDAREKAAEDAAAPVAEDVPEDAPEDVPDDAPEDVPDDVEEVRGRTP